MVTEGNDYGAVAESLTRADEALRGLVDQAEGLKSSNQSLSQSAEALAALAAGLSANSAELAKAADALGALSLESITSHLDRVEAQIAELAVSTETARSETATNYASAGRTAMRTLYLVGASLLIGLGALVVGLLR